MSSALAAVRGHPRHVLAIAVAIGLALAGVSAVATFVAAMFGVIALSASGMRAHVAVAAAALLLAGAGIGAARLASIDADPLAAARGTVSVKGTLIQVPRSNAVGTTLRVRATVGEDQQAIEIRSYRPVASGARIGSEVVATGSLARIDPATADTPEAAEYARYLNRNGVLRRMRARTVALTGGHRGGAAGVVDGIRNRADGALALGLAPEPAALLRGMVLGGDNGIPEGTVEDFRVSGLAHILAVSGQNVLLIVILIQAIAVALGASRNSRIVVSAAIVCIYVLLCGAQASVVRAGIMGLAGLAAIAASRPTSRLYALLLAAIAVLFWNPRATADVGAQLSFAAVLGIMAFTGPVAARLRRIPGWAAEALAATIGATIATAPLMALHFKVVSIVSLAANVIAEPLIGPIVWLGSITAAVGQLSAPLAALFNAPNGFLLGALIEVSSAAASMPGAQLTTEGFGTVGAVASALVICAFAAGLHGWIPFPRLPTPGGGTPRACVAITLAAVVVFVAALSVKSGARITRPAIVMLDVGQGDATLLLGAGGCSALIDGGPPGDGLAAKIRATGVRRLDAVLTTHPEDDHFGGILELAENGDLPVATLLDGGGNTDNARYAELRASFDKRGTRFEPAVAGTVWRCGDIAVTVIAPGPQAPDAPPPADPNTRAAVTKVDVGPLGMLASGDAESPQLLPLPLPSEPILKVPHHGSDDPGLPALLQRIRPSVALIGVGARNRFGHPTPATLGALEGAGAEVFRTDLQGELIVTPGSAGEPVVRVWRDG